MLLFSTILISVFVLGILGSSHIDCPADANEPWSYDSRLANGEDHWGDKYPACYGRMQSPIQIEQRNVINSDIDPLKLYNYDQPVTKALLENNGHTIKLTPKDGITRSFIVNYPSVYEEVGRKYTLDQLHFHFGEHRDRGSEHWIGKKSYAMELHLVHSDKDGNIAVIAVFYQRTEESDDDNNALKVIVNNLKSVIYKNDQVDIEEEIRLDQLVEDGCSFYRYNGSLTTPPCTEGVSWTICKEPLNIGVKQLAEFQKLYRTEKKNIRDEKQCKLVFNTRWYQDDNGRLIFSSL